MAQPPVDEDSSEGMWITAELIAGGAWKWICSSCMSTSLHFTEVKDLQGSTLYLCFTLDLNVHVVRLLWDPVISGWSLTHWHHILYMSLYNILLLLFKDSNAQKVTSYLKNILSEIHLHINSFCWGVKKLQETFKKVTLEQLSKNIEAHEWSHEELLNHINMFPAGSAVPRWPSANVVKQVVTLFSHTCIMSLALFTNPQESRWIHNWKIRVFRWFSGLQMAKKSNCTLKLTYLNENLKKYINTWTLV